MSTRPVNDEEVRKQVFARRLAERLGYAEPGGEVQLGQLSEVKPNSISDLV
jgi:hypothetical protein